MPRAPRLVTPLPAFVIGAGEDVDEAAGIHVSSPGAAMGLRSVASVVRAVGPRQEPRFRSGCRVGDTGREQLDDEMLGPDDRDPAPPRPDDPLLAQLAEDPDDDLADGTGGVGEGLLADMSHELRPVLLLRGEVEEVPGDALADGCERAARDLGDPADWIRCDPATSAVTVSFGRRRKWEASIAFRRSASMPAP